MDHELRNRGTSVLVTGATGLVGAALAQALREAGHSVIALSRRDGDVVDTATWGRLPAVEHAFHLAARSYVPDSWADPAGFIASNVAGSAQALEYCRANGAHLVLASTALFGTPKRLPVREDDAVEPNNPYALSKFLAERACAFYAAKFSIPVTVIRLVNIFGPGQRTEFLIPSVLDQVRRGERIRVKTLKPRRDFLFVDDAVAGLISAMVKAAGYRVVNVGSGASYSVAEVIDTIQAAAGTRLPVSSDEDPRVNEIPEARADITRARKLLGWAPRLTFAQGIARLVAAELRASPK
ncbi:MAG: NAD-dependent epimerase/dehydratase family protein [Xanthobacteraceae bacterium]